MSKAIEILKKYNFVKTTINSFENNDFDDNELHDLLNDECTGFQILCDQDTWSFCDGSYITRNESDYFDGDDVSDFELTHEIENG